MKLITAICPACEGFNPRMKDCKTCKGRGTLKCTSMAERRRLERHIDWKKQKRG